MTSDTEWAQNVFGFSWGESELSERLRALEDLVGSQAELVRIAGIEGAAYKMGLKRGSAQPADRIGALARATGVTLDYLVWGTPVTSRDAECEEKRFDLAARAFAMPSSPERRESRSLMIAQARITVEDNIARLAGSGMQERPDNDGYLPKPAGYALIEPILPTTVQSGQGFYEVKAPAPLAVAFAWLDDRQLAAASLRYVSVRSDEGGREFPAGSTVLVDCARVAPVAGSIFAMNIGGEVQLRRIVRRLSSTIELVHVHPSWPAETVQDESDAPILGTVVFAFAPV